MPEIDQGRFFGSFSMRRTWIEIDCARVTYSYVFGRSPCGERGLKYSGVDGTRWINGRSPCGERGLKSEALRLIKAWGLSFSMRRTWIEMLNRLTDLQKTRSRSPCGERGFEII